ncbi:MAG TPA: PIN domain-containing protein [Gammaproteobacteria bacterium]|nr:PIN domain-containing protein [Gammaproteobacteria bacterium]
MKYMLDTNICSYIIKNRPQEVFKKFKTLAMEDCVISSITLAELRYWVARNKLLHKRSKNQGEPNINELVIDHFVSHLSVEDFDSSAADVYGEIRADLESRGEIIGAEDLMIGAHAISLDCTLITNNLKEFKRLHRIRLENWIEDKS